MNSTALSRLIYTESLLALREPVGMFMAVMLPLAVFLALGFSVGNIEIPVDRDTGVVELFHVRDVLLAGNIAWVAAAFGIVALPQTLVEFRQHGIFRRYRVTPMPSYMLMVAPLAVGAAVVVVSLALNAGCWMVNIRHTLCGQPGDGGAGDIRFVHGVCRFGDGHHCPHPQYANRVGTGASGIRAHVCAERRVRPEGVLPLRAPTGGQLAAADPRLRSAHVPLAGRDLGSGDDYRRSHLGLLRLPRSDSGGLRRCQRATVQVGIS